MTLSIEGTEYTIRYTYEREDGSKWHVLNVEGGFYGEFGDEYPVENTFKM